MVLSCSYKKKWCYLVWNRTHNLGQFVRHGRGWIGLTVTPTTQRVWSMPHEMTRPHSVQP